MAHRVNREKALFRTHDAPFNRPEWEVGEIVDHKGKLYRVTRWLELPPIKLHRGGSLKVWEIWGRVVTDDELEEDLDRAARELLGYE